MIELSPAAMLVLFISGPLFVLGVLALYYNGRSLHRPAREKESIYECAECQHVYAIARSRPMDRCPRCGHLNEVMRA